MFLWKFDDPFDYDELNDEEEDYLMELIVEKFPEFEY